MGTCYHRLPSLSLFLHSLFLVLVPLVPAFFVAKMPLVSSSNRALFAFRFALELSSLAQISSLDSFARNGWFLLSVACVGALTRTLLPLTMPVVVVIIAIRD